jgi:hypothetical protein
LHTRAGLDAAALTADTGIYSVELCKLHDYSSGGAAKCFIREKAYNTKTKAIWSTKVDNHPGVDNSAALSV